MKKLIYGVVAAYIGICSSFAHADWEWFVIPRGYMAASSFDEAMATANEYGAGVIVYYTRRDCPPCRKLQANLRRDIVRQALRPDYVFTLVWSNGMKPSTRAAYRSRYGVRGAPTWIVYNRRGEYLCTAHGGFRNPEAGLLLHRRLQRALNSNGSATVQGPRSCTKLSA